jgi:hypothetical protein
VLFGMAQKHTSGRKETEIGSIMFITTCLVAFSGFIYNELKDLLPFLPAMMPIATVALLIFFAKGVMEKGHSKPESFKSQSVNRVEH